MKIPADRGKHGWRHHSVGDQLLQLVAITLLKAFERKRPEHSRSAAQHVPSDEGRFVDPWTRTDWQFVSDTGPPDPERIRAVVRSLECRRQEI